MNSINLKKHILKHTILFLFLMLFISPNLLFSQRVTVIKAEDYFNTENATSASKKTNALSVKSLVKELQPSVYIKNGVVNSLSETPKVLFTDIQSLPLVNGLSLNLSNVELVTIMINSSNDLQSTLNLNVLSQHQSIKTIYLKLTIDSDLNAIYNLFNSSYPNYTILYTIEKPS